MVCRGGGRCQGPSGAGAGARAGMAVGDPKHPVPQTGGCDGGRAGAHVYRATGQEPGEKSWRQPVHSKW